ncbi:hypothetical protein PLICRDRAFT_176195 [Plicaturopsis crispa FD-325 SS-3]|nr:hypothetical protein PLICRDRAFT_176195 [Plicaturopsis crispa FD-325 SS-3]
MAHSEHSHAHNDPTGSALMSFKPINDLHQHICAFHVYSHDRTRHVEAHHYCTHLTEDLHQCIIYDTNEPKARLIGIEYIVTEKVFKTLSAEEKKYWHSHNYEIGSALLQLETVRANPNTVDESVEGPVMQELYTTYGKTIHTWAYDTTPDLPLGPPSLMLSYTADGQIPQSTIDKRDKRTGTSTAAKRKLRDGYLDKSYKRVEGVDTWETGKAIVLEPIEREVKGI